MFKKQHHTPRTKKVITDMIAVLNQTEAPRVTYWDLGVARLRRVCDNKGWNITDVFDSILKAIVGAELCDNITTKQMSAIATTMHNFASYNTRKVDGDGYHTRLRRAVFHAVED